MSETSRAKKGVGAALADRRKSLTAAMPMIFSHNTEGIISLDLFKEAEG
jgi:hypothetical protein